MYNKFKINFNEVRDKEKLNILTTFITNLLKAEKRVIHLIIEGSDNKFLDNIRDSDYKYFSKVRLYKNCVKLKSMLDVDANSYIDEIDDTQNQNELISLSKILYLNKLDGFNASNLRYNSICDLKFNNNIINVELNGKIIGNSIDGFNEEEYENIKYIGLNGACGFCLNPLCDMKNIDKNSPFKNCIDESYCERNIRLLKNVPKEVQEVTKQEMMFLLELLSEMRNSANIQEAILLEKFFTEGKK